MPPRAAVGRRPGDPDGEGQSPTREAAARSRSRCGRRASTSARAARREPAARRRSTTSASSVRSSGCGCALGDGPTDAPMEISLDTFNEPNLAAARRSARSVRCRSRRRPASCWRGSATPTVAGGGGGGAARVTDPLDGIDLVVFDKDGTLIGFHAMWGGWAVGLGSASEAAAATGRSGRVYAIARLRPGRRVGRRRRARWPRRPMAGSGRRRGRARRWLASGAAPRRGAGDAWHAPDPVGLAHPLADLPALFARLAGGGRTDRGGDHGRPRARPMRTLDALGLRGVGRTRSSARTTACRSSRRRTSSHVCASARRPAGADRGGRRLAGGPADGAAPAWSALWRPHRCRDRGRARAVRRRRPCQRRGAGRLTVSPPRVLVDG